MQRTGRVLALACALAGAGVCRRPLLAEGFSTNAAPSATEAQAARMACRYYVELLGVCGKEGVERQIGPLRGTEVDTVVCCPSGWRFFNYPSGVDATWKEPDKFSRDEKAYPGWRRMVDNLAAGGDPLRDALAEARKLNKRFVLSFRMNDNHYVNQEEFPTHSNFWREHPEFRLGDDSKSYSLSDTARVFNYLRPEVRDYYYAVLEELCARYDVDGVELDFQRAPRFFHDADMEQGRGVMTAHVRRIREMLDKAGAMRGRRLELGVRVLHTVAANGLAGLDVMAWDAAGWLDGITVSSGYIHTADTGIEGFVAGRAKARIYGELNYVLVQIAGTGHDARDRRYVTPEAYRAATLSYLERGADGVSFFNTYCVPQPELNKLTVGLLGRFKDLALLRRADKLYTCYPTPGTMFGKVLPAKDACAFDVFVADAVPGFCKRAVLRLETKNACQGAPVVARLNGAALRALASREPELFPPVAVNKASPKPENLIFFEVPVGALKFGANRVEVKNAEPPAQPCVFVSAELALDMGE
jgi:hypothetical protein